MEKEKVNPVINHSPDMGPYSMEETMYRAAQLSKDKWKMLKNRPLSFLLHAFAGGAIVAFGATLSLSVSAGIPIPGLQNLVMGLVFGFSLVVIMMTGMSLITAEMALGIIGVFHKKITIVQYILFVIAGYIGNALGSLSFMSLLAFAGGPFEKSIYALRAHALAVSKTGMDGLSIFLLGILCTWFLQTAMFMYLKARSDVGKMAVAYYGPFAFVGSMTEHAIANIGFIALPLLMQSDFTALTGAPLTDSGSTALLHWGFGQYGWAYNQVLTLMGNFIGGVLFVATVFHFVSNPRKVMLLYRVKQKRS
ncbi:formate/nitrite transporter family protein [Bacillus benzoevorans]|uniref:Formate/nitrite transporter FocA (FNT family) n=1 Tax=Bacillus benzoevorans TaxID=1456 RepID=A0A7X0HSZ3_9BACI|nr:formate/nitrite transporter family protein [Bacillus benzoevorans]MBB6446289.1 formate/nitrite transporter FocA (FNT family) [Bacillus benzoevorans]